MTGERERARGCLLGGALGDMLGNPIEMRSMVTVEAEYGPQGLCGPVPDRHGVTGRITDDTQLTLFTVEALLNARHTGHPEADALDAYLRWHDTQRYTAPPPPDGHPHRTGRLRTEPWLYARRAPGRACEYGVLDRHVPDPRTPVDGRPGPVNPDAKGCGALIRSAPFGFPGLLPAGADERDAFELAVRCATITHGHPTGYYPAGALAVMIHQLFKGRTVSDAASRAFAVVTRYPDHGATAVAIRSAFALATQGPADAQRVESLGGGWTAEETLAIALYAALAGTTGTAPGRNPVEAALLLSVNHSGDSDSTGAVCGNLLGAAHGEAALPTDWLAVLEGRPTITALADEAAGPGD
ncbi:ADP-ribosylglycohydrolase family protein [Streptomyces sp. TLI_171]|uniref:ADP-ribosylglycohydrolase family protein n=1 Tax=Streptomyces sp. TLI_171 TaxID=1938859 RepID=UPI000C187DB5|nr:ADP-ribosylglycohydrolase family protein [Streptomyces sp. TLI_171]RKE22714.1 ADP-ribosylglycohydrolase [Streptomyces sp. TLI_171]